MAQWRHAPYRNLSLCVVPYITKCDARYDARDAAGKVPHGHLLQQGYALAVGMFQRAYYVERNYHAIEDHSIYRFTWC